MRCTQGPFQYCTYSMALDREDDIISQHCNYPFEIKPVYQVLHMSSPCTHLKLFVCGINALLDITVGHQQHRHFIPAE